MHGHNVYRSTVKLCKLVHFGMVRTTSNSNISFNVASLFFSGTEPGIRLALFRVAWGILVTSHLTHELFSESAIPRYSDNFFHFKFPFFHWIPPVPEFCITMVIAASIVAGLFVTVGLFYRLAAAVFFILFTYLFLIDVSYYNNHYYLICIVSALMIFVDANATLSLDTIIKKRNTSVPEWQLRLLTFQFLLVYFYGGLSKIFNPEWLSNEGMGQMLVGSLNEFGIKTSAEVIDAIALGMTYGGLLFDLIIGLMLIWKRTFWLAAAGVFFFNISNALAFNIGVFPYIMIASLILFYPVRKTHQNHSKPASNVTKLAVGIHVLMQLLIPLRHLAIDGDSFWTSEGYLFSWNMKPGTKTVDATFIVIDESAGLSYEVNPRDYLSPPAYLALGKYPFVTPQFARYIKGKTSKWYIDNPQIRAHIMVSRNRGPLTPVVDSTIDISSVTYRPFEHNNWLLIKESDK